jgi:hypothetical protein
MEKKTYKSNFKTIYRMLDNDYYLVSSKEEIAFEKENKEKLKIYKSQIILSHLVSVKRDILSRQKTSSKTKHYTTRKTIS